MKLKVETQKPALSRRKPDFTGVPGELISLDALPPLEFGKNTRKSPYDALLDKLALAGKGMALKFGDPRARVSLAVRARKKGLRISFAERDGHLYVRLDGRMDDDIRGSRRLRIKEALKFGPRAASELTNFMRDKGDTTIDMITTDCILAQMAREGEVIRQEGGKWAGRKVSATA